MSVTATFQPISVSTPPGEPATLRLHLHNEADDEQVVRLKATGDLADVTVVQPATVYLEPGETFEVPVVVDVLPSMFAGSHKTEVEVTIGEGAPITAEGAIDVAETSSYSITLSPARSQSAIAGKHRVSVDNDGNVPVSLELTGHTQDHSSAVELAVAVINVDPGKNARVDLRVHPHTKFWNGELVEHQFSVRAYGSDDNTHEIEGTYVQGPRVRPWLVPALVGMVGALLLGTLAWFTLLKPSVESIADDRADAANAADKTFLDDKIAELEAAAAEARDLPLGTPADLPLVVEVDAGVSATESFTVASDRVLSVTDVVFQNPDGAVGRISLLRSGEVLLESELANFRDLDFHFVAPFRFNGSDTVEVNVECTTPGPGTTSCSVRAVVLGFVDRE